MRVIWVLIFSALICQPIQAQSLDDLFKALQSAPTTGVAQVIENQIWQVWLTGPTDQATQTMQRIVILMQHGENPIALSLLNDLIDKQPSYAEAWNKRATLHYLMGNYQAAIADIDQTLSLEPRHFGALSGLGIIMRKLNRIEEAIAAHEQVLKIYPLSVSSRLELQQLYQMRQQLIL